eukprot:CAMPEP_0184499292 /NCGR_PEP_ID=MMETSP0113_2-20130426/41114_1 /TAXON_ID=91329 /ORGANISM="Norrisiella sphaerica, Strain BC52" /LENGTH=151 /DNA_ID=CAMNT_0026887149 /DNA_START=101 /DNA_END=553 /DNA_ORIENTATION=-
MGCSASANQESQPQVEGKCASIMIRLVSELNRIDHFQRVTRDVKKFVLGRRIAVQILLEDVWLIYMGTDKKKGMSEKIFNEIFAAYTQAMIFFLPQWVDNMLMLSLDYMGTNLTQSEIKRCLTSCKDEIEYETNVIRRQFYQCETVRHKAW